MRRMIAAFAVAMLALTGCDGGRVQEKSIEVKPAPALDRAKELLEKYAKGQPLGSESTQFAALVADVRKEDAQKADILEKGFADLQKPKVNVAAKAKEILAKIAPQPNAK